MKKLLPQQIRAVLKELERRVTYREIQHRLDVAKSTVGYIKTVVAGAGTTSGQALKLDDNELLALIYPIASEKQPEPDWQYIHSKLHRRGITLQTLYTQYQEDNLDGAYSYASFCRRYLQWKAENGVRQVAGNVEKIPGERMEIDFAGDKIEWVDREGEIHQSKLFVATLPFSCLVFSEAFEDESQSSWINGVIDALEYFELRS